MFRRIGWQVVLVGLGFFLAAGILAYLAATYTTESHPAPGGTYVESIGGYPQSLNPLLSFYNDADSDVIALTFSGLTRMTPQGEVEPDLARGWEIDPGGITYTFHLRTDALWHDGTPVVADDVLFTISLLQDPDYPGPSDVAALWQSVKAVRVDDYTVQFVLSEPYAPFMDYTTIGLLPAQILKGIKAADLPTLEYNREPIGCGPYRVAEVTEADGQITAVTLKRFTRYYGQAPNLENVILRFYPNARAAFDAYQDGAVEGVARIPADLLTQSWSEKNLNLYTSLTSEMGVLYFNELISDTLPFGDNRVRQALMFALDRQAIVDQVLMGQAVVPDSPFLPGTWAYSNEDVPQYTYDLQRADALMLAAGWTHASPREPLHNANGATLNFTLIAANEPLYLGMAQAIADQWAQIGVSVTVQGVPPLALSGILEARSYQAALFHLAVPGDPDPYPLWNETQVLGGQNYAGFRHRQISEIVEQARLTTDRERRRTLYKEFQQLFMQELPALPLYIPTYTYGVDSRVQGVQIGPMLMQTGDRFRPIADWYVLQRRVVVSENK